MRGSEGARAAMRRTPATQHAHHAAAVDALVGQIESGDLFDAVILCGSVGRGRGRSHSDLDVYLIASESEYRTRRDRSDLSFGGPCDYPGGYVDGKVISLEVLQAVAERGPEPMRASFVGGQLVYSRIGDLSALLDAAVRYPEENRANNLRDFFSAMALNALYFGPQGMKLEDAFLTAHSATKAVLYAGRLVLALNRILYPCPKQLLQLVEEAQDRPEHLVELMRDLCARPSLEQFSTLFQALRAHANWGISDSEVLTRFMELDEWRWLEQEPELAQR